MIWLTFSLDLRMSVSLSRLRCSLLENFIKTKNILVSFVTFLPIARSMSEYGLATQYLAIYYMS